MSNYTMHPELTIRWHGNARWLRIHGKVESGDDPPLTNGRWLIRGLVGNNCCRNPYQPCHPACKVMWKIWIVIVSVFLLASAVINLGIGYWKFQPLEDHPEVFIGVKLKRMCILGPRMLPAIYVVLNVASILLAFWTLSLVFVNGMRNAVTYGVFRSFSTILHFCSVLLLVLEVVNGWGEWPDDVYEASLQDIMTSDLNVQDVDNVSTAWKDTQLTFGCCGVTSRQDWYSVPRNNSGSMRTLPASCCLETNSEADFCYEPLSSSWNDVGCLKVQIAAVKSGWLFLFISTILLLISLDTVYRAVMIYVIKFPVQFNFVVELTKSDMPTPSSAWGAKPPPPRRPRKPKKLSKVPDTDDDTEREPLLKNVPAPEPNVYVDGTQSVPVTPEALFLYRSPHSASVGSDRSEPTQSASGELSKHGLHEPFPSRQSLTKTGPPAQAGDPPQIYFPTKAPSYHSSTSDIVLKPKTSNPQLAQLPEDNTHVSQLFFESSPAANQKDGLIEPHHGNSVPLLLQTEQERKPGQNDKMPSGNSKP